MFFQDLQVGGELIIHKLLHRPVASRTFKVFFLVLPLLHLAFQLFIQASVTHEVVAI